VLCYVDVDENFTKCVSPQKSDDDDDEMILTQVAHTHTLAYALWYGCTHTRKEIKSEKSNEKERGLWGRKSGCMCVCVRTNCHQACYNLHIYIYI